MPPAPQAAVAANSILAVCYVVIDGLIFIGLVRERRLGFNSLGTAAYSSGPRRPAISAIASATPSFSAAMPPPYWSASGPTRTSE